MKYTGLLYLLLSAFFLTSCGSREQAAVAESEPRYVADWDSLAKYDEAADWFKDAKFGIYAHWGVLSVPAYANDWFPRNMHVEGTSEYEHHVKTYGPHSEFGYHDYVPMFKAEEFDADAWAELWKKAGAKFGGIVAIHHDGWSNWDSEINPWNSVDMGPNRDIVGELEKAIKMRDMKFVTTFHKARNLQIFQQDSTKWLDDTSYFPYNPKLPTSSEDSLLSIMYGNIPKEQFYRNWLGELKEVIDNYSPDLIYFDGKLNKLPDSLKRQFVAYYLNHADAKNKEVVITHKEGELPKSVSLEDLEKGRMKDKTEEYWLTDETVSVGSWSYTKDLGLKTADEIIDLLADIVSKNGALMLNVSPKANGVIPQNQQEILLEIGDWLERNGEAIYGTRTWEVFGEGPTKQERSGMFLDKLIYTAEDVRYTKKGDNIYAIFLGWPGDGKKVKLNSFSKEVLGEKLPKIKSVSVLGEQGTLDYELNDAGLHFTTPQQKVDEKAFVVKIETQNL
ncbi:alpha-L-fucosidase [Salinimicrobium sp. HB62]|uniref:alpha-L-fucosidase n=1 Tax=Salinimicrobium sp. HB62 TaxID=3077781 RepID=UPI002D77577C|nr:alpha-L-fucosidase [Salinimicrobium sp. HB62]